MYAMERKELIERLLLDEGRVSVIELARRFKVTTETVRRDLDQLERIGALRRVHGGAVTRDRDSTAEPTLAERSHLSRDAKAAIARRALELIGDRFRGSLYLDAGTTTDAVAAQLADRLAITGGQAEIVTHAMTLAHTLAGAPDAALTVIGGRVRTVTAAAVGADTVRAIERLRPDIAFLGTNGISASFGLSTPDPDEAGEMYDVVVAGLERLGYRWYEVSNFAKAGRRCRHNSAIWRGETYLGLGPAAVSGFGDRRRRNLPDLEGYLAALAPGRPTRGASNVPRAPAREEEVLDPATRARERLFLAARTGAPVPLSELAEVVDPGTLPPLLRAGFVRKSGGTLRVTRKGRMVANDICVRLFRDLSRGTA